MGESEGRPLRPGPARQQDSQLYGNGSLGAGGAPLTDASAPAAQPCRLRSGKQVCPPVLLTRTQQGRCAASLRAGAGLPGSASPLVPLAGSPAGVQPQTPRRPCHSRLCPCGERSVRVGCSCLWSRVRCSEEQNGGGLSLLCVLEVRTARSLAEWHWCLLPCGTQEPPRGRKGPAISPRLRAPFVRVLEGTVFQIQGIHPCLGSEMHTFPLLENSDARLQPRVILCP